MPPQDAKRLPAHLDAMAQNAGSNRPPLFDPEEWDGPTGTTSGQGLRGKPRGGSLARKGL